MRIRATTLYKYTCMRGQVANAGPSGRDSPLNESIFAALAPLGLPDPATDRERSNRRRVRSATLAKAAFETGHRITIGLVVAILHFAALRYILLAVGAVD